MTEYLGNPPVKVGQCINLPIISEGEKGDGVGKVEGYVIFVPGAKKGEEVQVKITRTLPKVGFAEILAGEETL